MLREVISERIAKEEEAKARSRKTYFLLTFSPAELRRDASISSKKVKQCILKIITHPNARPVTAGHSLPTNSQIYSIMLAG
jgi:hypothetical protein